MSFLKERNWEHLKRKVREVWNVFNLKKKGDIHVWQFFCPLREYIVICFSVTHIWSLFALLACKLNKQQWQQVRGTEVQVQDAKYGSGGFRGGVQGGLGPRPWWKLPHFWGHFKAPLLDFYRLRAKWGPKSYFWSQIGVTKSRFGYQNCNVIPIRGGGLNGGFGGQNPHLSISKNPHKNPGSAPVRQG